jgi:hypothetical protein
MYICVGAIAAFTAVVFVEYREEKVVYFGTTDSRKRTQSEASSR